MAQGKLGSAKCCAGSENAGMTGLALPEDAQQKMLHLDDEIAGLIEAAEIPADQAGAHSTKPELVSPVAGELICGDQVGCCNLGTWLC